MKNPSLIRKLFSFSHRFRLCCSSLLILLSFSGSGVVHAQSFSVSFPDTIAYGPAVDSTALSCWVNDYVTNLSGQPLVLDVVRVEDVTVIPGWSSAFCFQTCQIPEKDSIRATLSAGEAVNIAVHFEINSIPDSGTVLMKYKNANNPSEVVFQRFYGISYDATSAASPEGRANNIRCYPVPVRTGEHLYVDCRSSLPDGARLEILGLSGNKIVDVQLVQGINTLPADLPAGCYLYNVSAGNRVLRSGKLLVIP